MITRSKVLALSFFPAFVPPNNGGVERLFNFYAELSRHHDVVLISSSFLDGEREVVRHRPAFTEIRVPKDAHFASAYADLSNASGEGDISGPALGKSSETFGALHDEYLAHYPEAEIIIHDSPFLINCDLFRGFDSKLRVYNSYNCETDLYSSFHEVAGQPNRIADLVRDLEAELCAHSDVISVCSNEDGAAFKRHFSPRANIIMVPNGFTPGPSSATAARDPRSIVFLGSAHKPNVDAVRLIVDTIAPKLPEVEFHLIGSCHPKARMGNVTAHGLVSQEEKEALLRRATAAINPMLSGGGSSLKIADIASNGCPLISTELGARGFKLEADVHYLPIKRDDPAGSVRQALADRTRLDRIAGHTREHFEQHYSWGKIAASFVSTLALLEPVVAAPRATLVLNDYDSLGSVGGGATRTAGLCKGLSATGPVIFLAFAGDDKPRRRISADGRILSLLVDKSPQHLAEHALHDSLHWISTADVVSYSHAPQNDRLMALFRGAAANCKSIVCEHPYMVGVPRAFGVDFVYSSQNFESGLKSAGLDTHPLKAELLPLVREAEEFACAQSSFIVAVSDGDAASMGATYRDTAPILIIPNGADGAALDADPIAPAQDDERPIAIFMGSVHGPNFDAANWIAGELARSLPHWDFVLIGSVATALVKSYGPNVKLVGEVSTVEKTQHLHRAQVALNPMMSGSGSNVKMADYLQHGLPVLTTAFGARGYEWVPEADAIVSPLDEFKSNMDSLIGSTGIFADARTTRQATYANKLAMEVGGRRLARLIDDHAGIRKRALYVTYRYNEPARGGGEAYVVRLIHALAESGWDVDVVSPAAEQIVDINRFAAAFSGPEFQPVPTGSARVRSRKFPLTSAPLPSAALWQLWNYQADYEEQVVKLLTPPSRPCLAWGWSDPDAGGRWGFQNAGLYLPAAATLTLRGRARAPLWLQIFAQDGRRLLDMQIDGEIDLGCSLPAGFISLQSSIAEVAVGDDPRPLALYLNQLTVGSSDLLDDRISDLWVDANGSAAWMAALAAARAAVRDAHSLDLSELRGASDLLGDHVRDHVAEYDLLVTHNAVFKDINCAVAAARAAHVPSILIPHLHHDDDFYHFRDIREACADATLTLVSPRVVERMLIDEGFDNVAYHGPGVDASTSFSSDDVEAFRQALPTVVGDFFLVLGRKSAAKGYRDVIDALDQFPQGKAPTIVMIGPDEDQVAIDHSNVVYLERQPDAVVRGALSECVGLINMSRSESFGMVLVEAGLAAKPVLANRNCAAFADIVADGATGFLVSRDELASRMAQFQDDPALRRRLGQEARIRALEFDWKKVEADFVGMCNKVAAAGS